MRRADVVDAEGTPSRLELEGPELRRQVTVWDGDGHAATDMSTYPDVSVVCGALETSEVDRNAATNPVLIVEVLSDTTEAYDRGEKFAHYRRLPSLREYLLLSQHQPRIESYRRNAQGVWELAEAGAGETLTLAALEGVRLDVDLIYRDPLAAS
ncbi:MAG: Uma2 family endonuclease [Enhygromyxa sp.]